MSPCSSASPTCESRRRVSLRLDSFPLSLSPQLTLLPFFSSLQHWDSGSRLPPRKPFHHLLARARRRCHCCLLLGWVSFASPPFPFFIFRVCQITPFSVRLRRQTTNPSTATASRPPRCSRGTGESSTRCASPFSSFFFLLSCLSPSPFLSPLFPLPIRFLSFPPRSPLLCLLALHERPADSRPFPARASSPLGLGITTPATSRTEQGSISSS